MSYKYIILPNNKIILTNSKKGKKIIKNFIYKLIGSAQIDANEENNQFLSPATMTLLLRQRFIFSK